MTEPTDQLDLARRGADTLAADGYHRQADAVRWLIALTQPSGIVEIPDTVTQEQAAEFRRAWVAETSGPQRLAVLSYEWGVRHDWAHKTVEPYSDVPFPSRAEAEEEVALNPQWRTLIRRTVTHSMPERGPWYPEADLTTYVLTPDGFTPVSGQENPSDQDPESGESPHE